MTCRLKGLVDQNYADALDIIIRYAQRISFEEGNDHYFYMSIYSDSCFDRIQLGII